MGRSLQERIAALEARLRQNSQNSSRPPSSDPPHVVRMPKAPPSGRKPGGQPGHEGHGRAFVAADRVNRFVDLKPARCRRCGRALSGEDPSPRRHQVSEVPRVEPFVTEDRLHTLPCACGTKPEAASPKGVPRGAFGPSVQALAALCTGVYHLSKRVTRGLLHDLFRVDLSLGSVTACEVVASQALAVPFDEAHAYAQRQEIGNADEPGWREARRRAWLWVLVTALLTVFKVHTRRGAKRAASAWGSWRGRAGCSGGATR